MDNKILILPRPTMATVTYYLSTAPYLKFWIICSDQNIEKF